MSGIPEEDRWISPQHDPFDSPDAEDEADTRERVLEGGEDAGDGDTARVREELGLDEPGASGPARPAGSGD
jgi:hypothetical protein